MCKCLQGKDRNDRKSFKGHKTRFMCFARVEIYTMEYCVSQKMQKHNGLNLIQAQMSMN